MTAVTYGGRCPRCARYHGLTATPEAIAAARRLLSELRAHGALVDAQGKRHGIGEGRMVGVLLGARGEVLRAYSGWVGDAALSGWAPNLRPAADPRWRHEEDPVARWGREVEALEGRVAALRARARQRQARAERAREEHERRLRARRDARRRERAGEGVSASRLAELERQAQRDSSIKRRARRATRRWLRELWAPLEALELRLHEARAQRRQISRGRMDLLHGGTTLRSFRGEEAPVAALFAGAPPSGVGDCCAPKLLAEAQARGITPVGLAEIWWGPATDPARVEGEVYGACAARCEPILGFMLCGLERADAPVTPPPAVRDGTVDVLFHRADVLVVNKPAGVPAVPGRRARDCVVERLRREHKEVYAAHRLDMDTSGVMVLALTAQVGKRLAEQFEARTVRKVYEARVQGGVSAPGGEITLYHRVDPDRRPYQVFDASHGKRAITRWRRLVQEGDRTRVEMEPITGRTHQLRFAAAHPQGLGHPICGDRLYGDARTATRLELHAREIELVHPVTGERVCVAAPVPF